jgi:transposase
MTLNDDVLIAVDPHKASNTAAVLDPVTKTVIETARFANTEGGYEQLTAFAARWSQRRWAVEGCHGAYRSLAQRLVAGGEMVLDVPAKLAARVRVYSRGHGRKTDKDDAISVGLAALDGTGVFPVASDDATVSLRLLCDRREELGALRTQAVCRLHRLLAELTPGGMRRELSANKAQALLARIRPADDVSKVRMHIARDHLADIRALDARITYLGAQIAALVAASGTGLTGLFGVGPVIAGRLLAETGDVARFATKDTFASYNGTAPIDVSSGDQVRHRLSRAGNRRINHALHMMAVTQIRYPTTAGRLYYEQKRREGKTPRRRCGASSGGCLTWSTASSSPTGAAQSKGADHLRPRRRRGLHPPHRPAARTRPHHPAGPHAARHRGIRRAGLERGPPRRHRNPRRQHPPPPRPPRTGRNQRLKRRPLDREEPIWHHAASGITSPTVTGAALLLASIHRVNYGDRFRGR